MPERRVLLPPPPAHGAQCCLQMTAGRIREVYLGGRGVRAGMESVCAAALYDVGAVAHDQVQRLG